MSGYERGIFNCSSVGSGSIVSLFQPPVFILQVGNRLMKGTDLRQQTGLSHVYSLELQTWVSQGIFDGKSYLFLFLVPYQCERILSNIKGGKSLRETEKTRNF